METLVDAYGLSITALGAVAALMLVQVLVADLLGIANKHTPGSLVEADHGRAFFRATRAVGNTNESVAIFICALLFCMFSQASPSYTAYAAWAYAISRALYAVCYYGNLQILRSTVFGVSLLALVALLVIGVLS